MACGCTSSILSNCSNQDLLNLGAIIASLGCGPLGTNLTYQPAPTNGLILSSTGTPAFVPLVNNINAGLLGPGDYASFLTRTQWMGDWKQQQYFPYQQVLDEGYLAIAKVTTSERPSPQKVGEPFNIYQGTIGSTTASPVKQILFGNKYTFTENVFFEGWRINLVAGNRYTVYLVRDPDGESIISQILQFVAQSSGWINLSAQNLIIQAGNTYAAIAAVTEPTGVLTTFNGNWNYAQPQNPTAPVNGQITQPKSNPSILYISNIDSAAANRSAELATLNIGDTIKVGTNLWAVQTKSPQTGYFIFGISPALLHTPLGVQNFIFETKSTATLTYPRDVNYWALHPPTIATITGLLGIDIPYNSIIPDNTAYGLDLLVQTLVISDDWDIQAISGVGGSGAGGASALVDLTDVLIASPVNTEVLTYDGGLWKNKPSTGGTNFWTQTGLAQIQNNNAGGRVIIGNSGAGISAGVLIVNGIFGGIEGRTVVIQNGGVEGAYISGSVGKFAAKLDTGGFVFRDQSSGLYTTNGSNAGIRSFSTGDLFAFDPIYAYTTFAGPTATFNVIAHSYNITNAANERIVRMINLAPTINQTGTATGNIWGLRIAPTITNIIGEFRAIEVVTGKVIIPNGNANNEAVNLGQLNRVQITITTGVDISTTTLSTDLPAISQQGKNVILDNGASNINFTCDGNITASYLKHGTGIITFVRGIGRELWYEGADVPSVIMNGLRGSSANLTTVAGTLIDYLAVTNY